MATIKISALPAAVQGNVTDAAYFPMDDATVTTVRTTVAQLRISLNLTVSAVTSVPTGTPTATITLPPTGIAIWLVSANISGAVSTNAAVCYIASGSAAATYTVFGAATGGGSLSGFTVSNAGVVSVLQASGSTQTVTVSAMRIQTS